MKLISALLLLFSSIYCFSTTVTIGTGTATQAAPFGSSYGYVRSASLYTSTEIGSFESITHLAWYLSMDQTSTYPVKIYLKSTSLTSLTSGYWNDMIAGASLVYDGSRKFLIKGWQTLDISDFNYTGENLLVLCETNYGGAGTGSPYFYYSNVIGKHQIWQTDNIPPSALGTINNFRPNIKLISYFGAETISIGTGTNFENFPFSCLFGFERSANLYKAENISLSGKITHLSWSVLTTSNTNIPIKIYLKNTTDAGISADTWDNAVLGATLVYDEFRQFSIAGLYNIDISDFIYSGNNLLVFTESNYGGSGNASNPSFLYYSGGVKQKWTADNVPPSGNGTVEVFGSQITFSFYNVIPPVITNQPDSQTACIGNSTQFSISATGDSLQYNWYHNNVLLSGNDSIYPLNNITESDTGSYFCIVNNSAGSDTSNTVYFTLASFPYVQLGHDSTVCSGYQLPSVYSENATYLWNNGITVWYNYATVSGMYSVTVTNSANCTSSDSVYLNVITEGTYTDTINNILYDSRDCQAYSIVKIGSQWWMAQNLNERKFRDGSTLSFPSQGYWSNMYYLDEYCDPNGNYTNVETYGRLYNWRATDDSRGLCSQGWHIPSLNEWNLLYLNTGYDSGKLKESGTMHWNSPNTSATNSTGFTALPAGLKDQDSSWADFGYKAYFWTSSQYSAASMYIIEISHDNNYITTANAINKRNGLSVRCIMDDEPVGINQQPGPLNLCEGQNGSIQLVATGTNIHFKWYHNGSLVAGPDNDTLYFSNAAVSQTGSYYCMVYNGNDTVLSNTVNVIVSAFPQVNLGNDTIICSEATMILVAGGQFNSYYWSTGQHATHITVSNAGVYSVTVTSVYGCSSSDSIIISEFTPLNIIVNTVNTTCEMNEGIASANVSGGTEPYSYLWNQGDTTNILSNLSAGIFTVSVNDINLCQNSASGMVSATNGAVIFNVQITQVSCFGESDGAISISVSGGTQPYHFEWSNGDTINQNINNLTAGPYEIIVTDASNCQTIRSLLVSQPDLLMLNFNSVNASCGNSDGTASIIINGGTAPFLINWSNGGTASLVQQLSAGVYQVTVIDINSCVSQGSVSISESGAALVQIDSVGMTSCSGFDGAIYISAIGNNLTYNWSNGAVSQDLINAASGTYSVTVSNGGCDAVLNVNIPEAQPLLQPICIVTVDHTFSVPKNMLVWEKQQTTGISHYRIWKETTQSGVYQNVINIPYAAMSNWTDPYSNPRQRSWRYKISAVDSCGTESPLGGIHKTIHLTVNLGQGQNVNLIWNHYEGFNYLTYYIHRYRPQTGWVLHDSIPGNLFSYTDTVTGGIVKYKVVAKRDNECWSSGDAKLITGPFSQSLSNIEDNGIIEVNISENKNSNSGCNVYPNPSKDIFTVETLLQGMIEIMDMQGKILKRIILLNQKTNIDCTNLSPGVYTLRFISDKMIEVKKIIKE